MSGGTETPVVAGAVFGLRVWRVAAGSGNFRLTSAAARHDWVPGDPTPATCRKTPHDAPAADCTCGYYSFHQSPASIGRVLLNTRQPGATVNIAGIVKSWGRTEVHETGMRSEFAIPDVLFLPTGASDGFQEMVCEIAEQFGAEIWTGGANDLLSRARDTRPGLAPELTAFSPAAREEAASGRKAYRLAAISPSVARRSTEYEPQAGPHRVQPRGFWLETSLPSVSLSQMATSHGHRIVRLENVTNTHPSRRDKESPEPGTELMLDRRGRESAAVTTRRGLLVGFLPPEVTSGLKPDTRAWLLCEWLSLDNRLLPWPRQTHVLLAESGSDRQLTFPEPASWSKRPPGFSPEWRRRRFRRDGAGGGGPVGPHDGPDG